MNRRHRGRADGAAGAARRPWGSTLAAGCVALFDLVTGRRRSLALVSLATVLAAAAIGGAWVPVHEFRSDTPYIGLDWFILDLLGSTALCVALERAFPLHREQPVFRQAWQADLVYVAMNHFLVGVALLVVNALVHRSFGWLVDERLQQAVRSMPFVLELLACLLLADLVQCRTHRAFREIPVPWRFHAIHHGVRTIDWLAGSRLHLVALVATRVAVLGRSMCSGSRRR